jgi:hypothetical protein
VENSYGQWAEDAAWVAIVQVPPHSRQRQNVITVIVFARVSMILPVQKGHLVGRVTVPLSDSDILAVLPESPCHVTCRSMEFERIDASGWSWLRVSNTTRRSYLR